jgi:hypothetical protein
MRLAYALAWLCLLALATSVMFIVHGNWWIAVLPCVGLSLVSYLVGTYLLRRRVRRGEVIRFEGSSDTWAIPFAAGAGGTTVCALALGSFVETLMCLFLAAASGLLLSAARFQQAKSKHEEPGSASTQ